MNEICTMRYDWTLESMAGGYLVSAGGGTSTGMALRVSLFGLTISDGLALEN